MLETSHAANKPEKLALIITQRTFYCFVGGLSLGLITCAAMRIVNGYAIALLVGGASVGPALISRFLYLGDFPGDRLERVRLKLSKKFRIFRQNLHGEDIAGHWSAQPSHDPDSIYNQAGDEFLGYEVQGWLNQAELRTLCKRLHKKLPAGASVTYIRLAEDFRTDFLQRFRPALIEKRVMGVEYFITLKIPYLRASMDQRASLLDEVPSFFFRITRPELRHLAERVIDPHKRNKEGETPFFEASHVTDGRYSFPYPDECYAAMSMSKLAARIDERCRYLQAGIWPAFDRIDHDYKTAWVERLHRELLYDPSRAGDDWYRQSNRGPASGDRKSGRRRGRGGL